MSTIAPDAVSTGVRTYNVDPAHSSVNFSIRHLMIAQVRGTLTGLSGTMQYNPVNKATSSVDVVIDATTFSTGTADRDAHVKSPDFIDAAQFPTISFKSTAIRPEAGDAGEIDGDLTLKGVTRPVTLIVDEESPEVTDHVGNLRIAFAAHTKVKRSDFGATAAMEAGNLMLSDELKVQIDIQFIRKP